MGKFGWLIFLIIIAANVIGPILQKRKAQLGKQRQQGADPAAEARPRSPAGRPQTTSPGPTRMEQLIARRQTQLEELRGRREQRRAGQSPQVRIGPASTPTTRPSPTVFRAPAPQPSPQPSRRVRRPAPASPAPPQRVQRRTPTVPPSPVAQPIEGQRLTTLQSGLRPSAVPTARPARKRLMPFDTATITPQLLRRMVVLKEIFDPPIALRNRDIWDKTC
ncbi:MAG: hypothetical protein V3T53_00695 [Phycisphaerales bacterium]